MYQSRHWAEEPHIRLAVPGELCTCGRQAITVIRTAQGDVGDCGIPDGGAGGPSLCPFCRGGEPHPHGRRCPRYRIIP